MNTTLTLATVALFICAFVGVMFYIIGTRTPINGDPERGRLDQGSQPWDITYAESCRAENARREERELMLAATERIRANVLEYVEKNGDKR